MVLPKPSGRPSFYQSVRASAGHCMGQESRPTCAASNCARSQAARGLQRARGRKGRGRWLVGRLVAPPPCGRYTQTSPGAISSAPDQEMPWESEFGTEADPPASQCHPGFKEDYVHTYTQHSPTDFQHLTLACPSSYVWPYPSAYLSLSRLFLWES